MKKIIRNLIILTITTPSSFGLAQSLVLTERGAFQNQGYFENSNVIRPAGIIQQEKPSMLSYRRIKCETKDGNGFLFYHFGRFQTFMTKEVFVNLVHDKDGQDVAYTISTDQNWDSTNVIATINNYARREVHQKQLNEVRRYNAFLESKYNQSAHDIHMRNEDLLREGGEANILLPDRPRYFSEPEAPQMMRSRYVVKQDKYGKDLTGMDIKLGDYTIARTVCVPTPHKLSGTKAVSADGAAYQNGKKSSAGAVMTEYRDYEWCDKRTMVGSLILEDIVLQPKSYEVICDLVAEGEVEKEVFSPRNKEDFKF